MPMPHPNEQLAKSVCMVREVDTVPKGHLRLETKFLYPDRSSIDLFVVQAAQTDLLAVRPVLSDLGQTTAWLANIQVRPWQSKKRQCLLDDALHALGVEQNGGVLHTTFEQSPQGLENAVVRLGQACIRVADLAFTRRSSLQAKASEDVEELISDADLFYETDVKLDGRHGSLVTVDFLVTGQHQMSSVLTLAAQFRGSAHTTANEVFRKLYDLNTPARAEQRVTILDDRYDVYRDEDIERIRDVSVLVPLSAREEVVAVLSA